jgi:hypothetical protein
MQTYLVGSINKSNMASLKTATLFAALKDAGVTNVEIRYDGGGDSGQVEDVEFYGDNIDSSALNDKFEGNLQDLGYYILEQHYNWDWYNNDGGYGTINIELIDEPVILIDGYVRSVTDAHDSVNLTDINWEE